MKSFSRMLAFLWAASVLAVSALPLPPAQCGGSLSLHNHLPCLAPPDDYLLRRIPSDPASHLAKRVLQKDIVDILPHAHRPLQPKIHRRVAMEWLGDVLGAAKDQILELAKSAKGQLRNLLQLIGAYRVSQESLSKMAQADNEGFQKAREGAEFFHYYANNGAMEAGSTWDLAKVATAWTNKGAKENYKVMKAKVGQKAAQQMQKDIRKVEKIEENWVDLGKGGQATTTTDVTPDAPSSWWQSILDFIDYTSG